MNLKSDEPLSNFAFNFNLWRYGEGYECNFMRVDTKKVYIPHTRTRVYLFAARTGKGPEESRANKGVCQAGGLLRTMSRATLYR